MGKSTKTTKRRANSHNSRKGTNGKPINPKHNDRDFDVNSQYATHIDAERVSNNVYWKYQDVPSAEQMTFEEYELAVYEQTFRECLDARNQKAIQSKQPKRVQTMEQFIKNAKACPEESIFTVGNAENPISPQQLAAIYEDFIAWHKEQYPNVMLLDAALHVDEANPHIHWRRVWVYHEDDILKISQKDALAEMEIERPDLTKDVGRYNNAKVTYTLACHEKQIEIARKHGFEIEEEPQEPSMNGLSMLEYQNRKELEKAERIVEQIKQLEYDKSDAVRENIGILQGMIARSKESKRNIKITAEEKNALDGLAIVLDAMQATELDMTLKKQEYERNSTDAERAYDEGFAKGFENGQQQRAELERLIADEKKLIEDGAKQMAKAALAEQAKAENKELAAVKKERDSLRSELSGVKKDLRSAKEIIEDMSGRLAEDVIKEHQRTGRRQVGKG